MPVAVMAPAITACEISAALKLGSLPRTTRRALRGALELTAG